MICRHVKTFFFALSIIDNELRCCWASDYFTLDYTEHTGNLSHKYLKIVSKNMLLVFTEYDSFGLVQTFVVQKENITCSPYHLYDKSTDANSI